MNEQVDYQLRNRGEAKPIIILFCRLELSRRNFWYNLIVCVNEGPKQVGFLYKFFYEYCVHQIILFMIYF